jgi:hypothetical protein
MNRENRQPHDINVSLKSEGDLRHALTQHTTKEMPLCNYDNY